MACFDVAKAFDTMWVPGCLYKIHKFANIQNNMFMVLASFLTNRRATVRINGCKSETFQLCSGVPQGSVLSPTIFSVYMSDFPKCLPRLAVPALFADDAATLVEINSQNKVQQRKDIDYFQLTLNKAFGWFTRWKLDMADKTFIRLFTPPKKGEKLRQDLSFTFGDKSYSIEKTGSTRYLGLFLDNNLNFDEHLSKKIDDTTKRISSLRAITGFNSGANRDTILSAYKVWIRPVLDYGHTAISNPSIKQQKSLAKIQRKALSMAIGTNQFVTNMQLDVQSSTFPMSLRRLYLLAVTGARLKRTPNQAVSQNFTSHINSNKLQLHQLPESEARPMLPQHHRRTKSNTSPFDIIHSIMHHLRINDIDSNPELLMNTDCVAPWDPLPKIHNHNRPTWLSFGSASNRQAKQSTEAERYGNNRILEAMNLIKEHGGLLYVTDGSTNPPLRIPDNPLDPPEYCGGGGAGIVRVHPNGHQHSYGISLGYMVVNEGAELYALFEALDDAIKHHDTQNPGKHIIILSDCQSAILITENTSPERIEYWTLRSYIRSRMITLNRMGYSVHIDWIPGHANIELNSKADCEAKLAAARCKGITSSTLKIPTPLSVVKLYIKEHLKVLWQHWWIKSQDSNQTNSNTKANRKLALFHPTIHSISPLPQLFKVLNTPRRLQVVIERLRMGNAMHFGYLHRMRQTQYSTCNKCQNPPSDSIDHRLYHCPSYNSQRNILQSNLMELGYNFDLSTVINF